MNAQHRLWLLDKSAVAVEYARCKGIKYIRAITSLDIVESITARIQLELGLPATNDLVADLADLIAEKRQFNNHVILVGHSEGTILQAQAVRELARREPNPLQVSNRCVAAVALAPAVTQANYGLDEYHLKGLLAQNDIIRLSSPGLGWEAFDTPLSEEAREAIARSDEPELTALQYGVRIHHVNDTYLGPVGAPALLAQLDTLSRECVAGRANFQLSTAVAPVGTVFAATLDIWNQNDRPLMGRRLSLSNTSWMFERLDSLTFRAMTPYDGVLSISARINSGFSVEAPIIVPLVVVPFSISEVLVWDWVSVAASNGPNGSWNPGPKPTEPWSGDQSSCPRRITINGSSGDWQTWELQCSRTYTPIWTAPDTLASGRRVNRTAVYYTYATGVTDAAPTTYYYCPGSAPCIQSGFVEILDEHDGVVGRSPIVIPSRSLFTARAAGYATRPANRGLMCHDVLARKPFEFMEAE